MRITSMAAIDDPGRSSSDIQRCTDVRSTNAKIHFRFDNLESRRRLGVAANPVAVAVGDLGGGSAASVVISGCTATMQALSSVRKSDIRGQQQSLEAAAAQDHHSDDAGLRNGIRTRKFSLAVTRPKYLLRGYDSNGNFDETDARPLRCTPSNCLARGDLRRAVKPRAAGRLRPETIWRASRFARQRHVKVQGTGIPAGHTVWVAGRQIPRRPAGQLRPEEILPAGAHSVQVAFL